MERKLNKIIIRRYVKDGIRNLVKKMGGKCYKIVKKMPSIFMREDCVTMNISSITVIKPTHGCTNVVQYSVITKQLIPSIKKLGKTWKLYEGLSVSCFM